MVDWAWNLKLWGQVLDRCPVLLYTGRNCGEVGSRTVVRSLESSVVVLSSLLLIIGEEP